MLREYTFFNKNATAFKNNVDLSSFSLQAVIEKIEDEYELALFLFNKR